MGNSVSVSEYVGSRGYTRAYARWSIKWENPFNFITEFEQWYDWVELVHARRVHPVVATAAVRESYEEN